MAVFENVGLPDAYKVTTAKREEEQRTQHIRRLNTLAISTLGPSPAIEEAVDMANDLLDFEKTGNDWLVKKYRVDRGFFFVVRVYELRGAVKARNLSALLREIAEIRNEAGERGRFYTYKDERCFNAGWSDFEAWRAEKKCVS